MNVGDEVIIWPLDSDEAYDTIGKSAMPPLEWTEAHEACARSKDKGKIISIQTGLTCDIFVTEFTTDPNSHGFALSYVLDCHGEWLMPMGLPSPANLICTCPNSSGCTCGAMEREMAAKGMWKNPVTKLWEKRAK